MGSRHGFSLLLLVTSLVFSGVLGSSSRPALCDVSCCSVLPTCDNARVVTCDCPNMESMTLRKGDIPETVRSINILNTRHVTIDKEAINGLQYLTNFTISGIAKLEIKQDGMASHNPSLLRAVTFQNVGSLHIESKAFSGVWQPKTTIRMHRIGGLYVESNAFDYHVMELGPSVSLQHVEMLNLQRNGFASAVFEMNLYNVTMDVCHDDSFGGKTVNTEFNNVTITEARERCLYSLNDFATVNIRSLNMQNVYPQAFSGNIRELIIRDSHFTTMHERSFDLLVTSMEISDSYISELRSKGLSVLASDTLRIDTVRVENLRKNALVGLKMKKNKDQFDQPLVIRKLELIEAENGSLTFSECTKVRLTDVDLMAPWPRICPTEKWTQALSGGGVSGQLTPAQYQLFFQLFQRRLCYEDGWRQFPISVESPHCFAKNGEDARNPADSDGEDGESNAPPGDTFDVPAPVETRASPALPALPVTSAPDLVSPMVGDAVDAADRDRNPPSAADGHAGRAGSAGGARGSSRASPGSSPSDAVPADDRLEGGKDSDLGSSNSPLGIVVIDTSLTMELSLSNIEVMKVDAFYESKKGQAVSDEAKEESSASLDSQGSYAAESWEDVNTAGHHGASNSDTDTQRIPEDFWLVKKVLAKDPPNKTRDSLVGALRYRVGPEFNLVVNVPASNGPGWLSPSLRLTRDDASASPASSAFGAFQKLDQHQLLCIAVGAVLTLAVVLSVLLLLMMLVRRRPSMHPAIDQLSDPEMLYGEESIERVSDNDIKKSASSRVRTGQSGGLFYSCVNPSLGQHYYESSKSEHNVQLSQPISGACKWANFY